jgi:glycosyltransferase involved in cell wall biosynthesis
LELALLSLVQQTLPSSNFEIIVVDNGSRDRTPTVVAEFGKIFGGLRYICAPSPGLHVARHRGLREATGDILAFVDDDIEAFPKLLASIELAFENPKVALVGGKSLPKHEGQLPEWLSAMWLPNTVGDRILSPLSLIDLGERTKIIDPLLVFGCNFSIRRTVLIEANGFHPDGLPSELVRFRGDGENYVSRYVAAKGLDAFYHPEASVYHHVPRSRMTVEYLCQRAYNEGISSSYTKIRTAHGLDSHTRLANDASHGNCSNSLWARVGRKSLAEIVIALRNRAGRLMRIRSQSAVKQMSGPQDEYSESMAAAYAAGFAFHQKAVQESEMLLEWVLRPNYLDAQVPGQAFENCIMPDHAYPFDTSITKNSHGNPGC